jgi:hypothetical protein
MPNLSRQARARAVQLATLTLTLAAPAATAQSQVDADLKAITAHTLTMPKYKQYLDATVNLANAIVKNPELAKRLDGYGDESLADQVKLLEGLPQVRGAITSTGLTARDYVLTQGALLQAGMAYAMTKDGKVSADKMIKDAGVSRANLEFYQKNEAEIGRLAKEADARAPKVPEADDDGTGDDDDSGDDPAEE